MTRSLELPRAPRILAVCTHRLGDVLLTTPLLRSVRRAWPDARLDVVTLESSMPALQGNADLQQVVGVPAGAGALDTMRRVGWRAYDLAISTLHTDRAHLTAFGAASRRVNLAPRVGLGLWWKQRLGQPVTGAPGCHTVVTYLAVADALGIPRHYDVVPPRAAQPHPRAAQLPRPYAVIHPVPMYRYKHWSLAGWQAVIGWLERQGLRVVLTGGRADNERRLVGEVAAAGGAGVVNLCGELAFGELTGLIENAAVFAGTDTSVTHLAAATGVPTVTPFGPTSPVKWGPWPCGLRDVAVSPWRLVAPLQQAGNVWIVQGLEHCVPCRREGCEMRLDSRADCLDHLPASRVIAALDQALRSPRPSR